MPQNPYQVPQNLFDLISAQSQPSFSQRKGYSVQGAGYRQISIRNNLSLRISGPKGPEGPQGAEGALFRVVPALARSTFK